MVGTWQILVEWVNEYLPCDKYDVKCFMEIISYNVYKNPYDIVNIIIPVLQMNRWSYIVVIGETSTLALKEQFYFGIHTLNSFTLSNTIRSI